MTDAIEALYERVNRLEASVRELAANNVELVHEVQRLEEEKRELTTEVERSRRHLCYVPLEHQAS